MLAHLGLGMLNMFGSGYPLGDVTSVYRFWSDQVVVSGFWVGVDSGWVYPIVAIFPMLAARVLYPLASVFPPLAVAATGPGLYASTWLTMVMLLDVIAFGVLTGWGRRRDRVASGWWWIAFLLALGPIALGRIDSVTVPIAVVGVLLISRHPRAATIVLTVAAWIKVWPGAIVIAMVVATRDRWRVLSVAVAVSVGIVALALSFGSGANVLSFAMQQASRGLQAEAPVTTYWMWRAASASTDTQVYFDQNLLTWQVRGPGVGFASDAMTPLLLLAVAAVTIVGLQALRRGASARALLPPLTLALLCAMIAFQKVGSPQFISWLAVPVILGLVTARAGHGPSFRVPAAVAVVIAALTHLVYPYLYGYVIGLFPPMLIVLTVRNAMLFVLLGIAVRAIIRTPSWAGHPAAQEAYPVLRMPDRAGA